MSYPVVSSAPRGSGVIRFGIGLAVAKGNAVDAGAYAESRWGNSVPTLASRAVVSAASTDPASWEPIVGWDAASAEFFQLATEATLVGRMAGLRRMPLAVPVVSALTGASGAWVGETLPVPATAASFTVKPLPIRKAGAMAVITEALARSVHLDAERLIGGDLTRALGIVIDRSFIDPANGGSAIAPASILNGVAPLPAGPDASADVAKLIGAFRGDLSRAYFIGGPKRFATMAGPAFRDLGARGGEIVGIPALSSEQAPNVLALVDPGAIAFGSGPIQIDATTTADVQLTDTPAGGATTLVSLWQRNLVGLRCLQSVNWVVVRPDAIAFILYPA